MNHRERILPHSDERTPTPGRPSLLSTDQQVEADRNRILSELDGNSGMAGGNSRARRTSNYWIVAIVAVLSLGVGGGVLLGHEGEKQVVLAKTEPLAGPGLMSPPESVDLAYPNYEMGEASPATVLEDMPLVSTPPAALVEEVVTVAAPVPMVESRDAAHVQLVDVSKPVAKRPAKAPLAKNAKKSKAQLAGALPSKKRAEVEPAVVSQGDKDVALLAALVTHSKATQTKRNGGIAAKLKECRASATAKAVAQCRARVCSGSARGEPECKAKAAKIKSGS